MTDLDLPSASAGECSVKTRRQLSTITATFSGNADMRATEEMGQWIATIRDSARRTRVSEVVVDFRDLKFMNSSCFKAFVGWIMGLSEAPEGARHKVRFLSNPGYHWQKRSLNTLRCFAVDLVTVEE